MILSTHLMITPSSTFHSSVITSRSFNFFLRSPMPTSTNIASTVYLAQGETTRGALTQDLQSVTLDGAGELLGQVIDDLPC